MNGNPVSFEINYKQKLKFQNINSVNIYTVTFKKTENTVNELNYIAENERIPTN